MLTQSGSEAVIRVRADPRTTGIKVVYVLLWHYISKLLLSLSIQQGFFV